MKNTKTQIEELIDQSEKLRNIDSLKGARLIGKVNPEKAIEMLSELNSSTRHQILSLVDATKKEAIMRQLTPEAKDQWKFDGKYTAEVVGGLMEIPKAIYRPEDTVAYAVENLKELTKKTLVNYGFITDEEGILKGVFAFRELLFAQADEKLEDIAILNPFYLKDTMTINDAMQEVVTRHFPTYPVCDEKGKFVGILRGQTLFEQQAFDISSQAGKMQGVDKEERLSTPLFRSLKFRHPWLQLNLLTAFIAAAVVGFFQNTLDEIIVLAAFLPVLAGQSGNTGCQALAVTLRGLTLGELKTHSVFKLVAKECLLGLSNGVIVGLIAGAGMYYYSMQQGGENPLMLALIVWVAMTVACMVSGVAGATIPLILKKLGADPATASSIFLTTMTDVVSMGVFLGLATMTI
jgi:magnesium transporter